MSTLIENTIKKIFAIIININKGLPRKMQIMTPPDDLQARRPK